MGLCLGLFIGFGLGLRLRLGMCLGSGLGMCLRLGLWLRLGLFLCLGHAFLCDFEFDRPENSAAASEGTS